MQYSALLALSSALMAAGTNAVPYGMNPAQAAAMGSGMNSPWAISPPSAPSEASMAPMASSMKHSKPTIIPGMANSAMAHPSMAAMASPSSSQFSHGPNRNQITPQHAGDQDRDSFRAPQGETHGVEQSSGGWYDADGLSQGSNGVGNSAGMGQDASNESLGNEGNTPNDGPRPEAPAQEAQPQQAYSQNEAQDKPVQPQSAPPAQQPHEDQAPEHHGQNAEHSSQAPQPQGQDQTQPAHDPHPPANQAPQNTNQTPHNSPKPGHSDHKPSSPPHGDLAPVSPMQPGSNVAPMGFDHQNHGEDAGNAFCLGQCYPSEEESKCGGLYSSPMYKEELGCYTCCFTPQNF